MKKTPEEILSLYERDEFYDKNIIEAMQEYATQYHSDKLAEVAAVGDLEVSVNLIIRENENEVMDELACEETTDKIILLFAKEKESYNFLLDSYNKLLAECQDQLQKIYDRDTLLAKKQKESEEDAAKFGEWMIEQGYVWIIEPVSTGELYAIYKSETK